MSKSNVGKREACSKPCNDCPFRRKSVQGWLGASSPEEFMAQTMGDFPMPCHNTIMYIDGWEQRWANNEEGKLCAGSLIFFSNTLKVSRDRDRPRLATDRVNVFTNTQEFIEHHHSGPFKSWDRDSDDRRTEDEDDWGE